MILISWYCHIIGKDLKAMWKTSKLFASFNINCKCQINTKISRSPPGGWWQISSWAKLRFMFDTAHLPGLFGYNSSFDAIKMDWNIVIDWILITLPPDPCWPECGTKWCQPADSDLISSVFPLAVCIVEEDEDAATIFNDANAFVWHTYWWWLCPSPPAWRCLVSGRGGQFSFPCADNATPDTSVAPQISVSGPVRKLEMLPLRLNVFLLLQSKCSTFKYS